MPRDLFLLPNQIQFLQDGEDVEARSTHTRVSFRIGDPVGGEAEILAWWVLMGENRGHGLGFCWDGRESFVLVVPGEHGGEESRFFLSLIH